LTTLVGTSYGFSTTITNDDCNFIHDVHIIGPSGSYVQASGEIKTKQINNLEFHIIGLCDEV
jgi:hypothetical protein